MNTQPAFIREIEIRYKLTPVPEDGPLGRTIEHPGDIYSLFRNLESLNDEHLYAIFADAAHRIQSIYLAAKGGGFFASTDTASLLRAALHANCTSVFLVHNHPSGTLKPTPSDREFTQGIAHACNTVGLKFLDHVVIGHGGYFSFAQEGLIKGATERKKRKRKVAQ